MSVDAVLSINATFGERAAAEVEGAEAKVRASMKAVLKENWMETNEDALFRAAVAGAMLGSKEGSEERTHIQESFDGLKKASALIQALQSGVAVDLEATLKAQEEQARKPLPLLQWWREELKASNWR